MQFSDTTNKQGILEAARDYVSVSSNDYPTSEVVRNVNRYYKRAVNLIQKVDKRWRWDDNNHTDLPIETTTLMEGQPDYAMEDGVREVLRVEVLDSTGAIWRTLRKIDEADFNGSLEERFEQDAEPAYYELIGESVYLYPASDYTQEAGLKIYGKRAGSLFAATDTTKEPGFDSQYHDYLAIGAAYEYARNKKNLLNLSESLYRDLKEIESDMVKYYSRRGGDARMYAPIKPRI